MTFNGQNWLPGSSTYMPDPQGSLSSMFLSSFAGGSDGHHRETFNQNVPNINLNLPLNNIPSPAPGQMTPNQHLQAQIASTFNLLESPSNNMQRHGPSSSQLHTPPYSSYQHSGPSESSYQSPSFRSYSNNYPPPILPPGNSALNLQIPGNSALNLQVPGNSGLNLQPPSLDTGGFGLQGQFPNPFPFGSLSSHMQIPVPVSNQMIMPSPAHSANNPPNLHTSGKIPVVAVAPFQTKTSAENMSFQSSMLNFSSDKQSQQVYKVPQPQNLSTKSPHYVKPPDSCIPLDPLASIKKDFFSEYNSPSKSTSKYPDKSLPSPKKPSTSVYKTPATTVSINPLINIKKEHLAEFDTQTASSTRGSSFSRSLSSSYSNKSNSKPAVRSQKPPSSSPNFRSSKTDQRSPAMLTPRVPLYSSSTFLPPATTVSIYPVLNIKQEYVESRQQASTVMSIPRPNHPLSSTTSSNMPLNLKSVNTTAVPSVSLISNMPQASLSTMPSLTSASAMSSIPINPLINIKKEAMSNDSYRGKSSSSVSVTPVSTSATSALSSQSTPVITSAITTISINPLINIKKEAMSDSIPSSSSTSLTTSSSVPAGSNRPPNVIPTPVSSILSSQSVSITTTVAINPLINIKKEKMTDAQYSKALGSSPVVPKSSTTTVSSSKGTVNPPVSNSSAAKVSSTSDIVINPLIKVKQEYLTEKGKSLLGVSCRSHNTSSATTYSQAMSSGMNSKKSSTGIPVMPNPLPHPGARLDNPSFRSPGPIPPGISFPHGMYPVPPNIVPGLPTNLPRLPELHHMSSMPMAPNQPRVNRPGKPHGSSPRNSAPRPEMMNPLNVPNPMNTRHTSLFELLEILDKGVEGLFKYMCTLLPSTPEFMRVEKFCTISQKYKVKGIRPSISEEFYKSLVSQYITNYEVNQLKDKVIDALRAKGLSEIEIFGDSLLDKVGWHTERVPVSYSNISQQYGRSESARSETARRSSQDTNEAEMIKRAFTLQHMSQTGAKKDTTPLNLSQSRGIAPSNQPSNIRPSPNPLYQQRFPWANLSPANSSHAAPRAPVPTSNKSRTPSTKHQQGKQIKGGSAQLTPSQVKALKAMDNTTIDLTDEKGKVTDMKRGSGTVSCYLCSFTGQAIEVVWDHVATMHVGKDKVKNATSKFVCSHCSMNMNSYSELVIHENTHHLSKNPCYFCGLAIHDDKGKEDSLYWQHVILKHSILHTCSVCKGNFLTEDFKEHCELTKHEKYPMQIGIHCLQCPYCQQKFVHRSALQSHIIQCTGGNKPVGLTCKSCGKMFLDQAALDFHCGCDSGNPSLAPRTNTTSLAMLAQQLMISSQITKSVHSPPRQSGNEGFFVASKTTPGKMSKPEEKDELLASLADELEDEVQKKKEKAAKQKRKIKMGKSSHAYAFDEYIEFCEIDDRIDIVQCPKIMDTIVHLAIQEYMRLELGMPYDERLLMKLTLYVSRTPILNDFLQKRSMLPFRMSDKIENTMNEMRILTFYKSLPLKFGDNVKKAEVVATMKVFAEKHAHNTQGLVTGAENNTASSMPCLIPDASEMTDAKKIAMKQPSTTPIITSSQPLPSVPVVDASALSVPTDQSSQNTDTILPPVVPSIVPETQPTPLPLQISEPLQTQNPSTLTPASESSEASKLGEQILTNLAAKNPNSLKALRTSLSSKDKQSGDSVLSTDMAHVKSDRSKLKKTEKTGRKGKKNQPKQSESNEPQPSTSTGRTHPQRNNNRNLWKSLMNAYMYDTSDDSGSGSDELYGSDSEWKPSTKVVVKQKQLNDASDKTSSTQADTGIKLDGTFQNQTQLEADTKDENNPTSKTMDCEDMPDAENQKSGVVPELGDLTEAVTVENITSKAPTVDKSKKSEITATFDVGKSQKKKSRSKKEKEESQKSAIILTLKKDIINATSLDKPEETNIPDRPSKGQKKRGRPKKEKEVNQENKTNPEVEDINKIIGEDETAKATATDKQEEINTSTTPTPATPGNPQKKRGRRKSEKEDNGVKAIRSPKAKKRKTTKTDKVENILPKENFPELDKGQDSKLLEQTNLPQAQDSETDPGLLKLYNENDQPILESGQPNLEGSLIKGVDIDSAEEATDVYDSDADAPKFKQGNGNDASEETPVKAKSDVNSDTGASSVTSTGKKRRKKRKRIFTGLRVSDDSESDHIPGKKRKESDQYFDIPIPKLPIPPSRWCLKEKRKLVNDTLSVKSERVSNRIMQSYIYLHYYTDERIKCCDVKMNRLDEKLVSGLLPKYRYVDIDDDSMDSFTSEKTESQVSKQSTFETLKDGNSAKSENRNTDRIEDFDKAKSVDMKTVKSEDEKSVKSEDLKTEQSDERFEDLKQGSDKPSQISDIIKDEKMEFLASDDFQICIDSIQIADKDYKSWTQLLIPVSDVPSHIRAKQKIIDTAQGQFIVLPIMDNIPPATQEGLTSTLSQDQNSEQMFESTADERKSSSNLAPKPSVARTSSILPSTPTHLLVPISQIPPGIVASSREIINQPNGQFAMISIRKNVSPANTQVPSAVGVTSIRSSITSLPPTISSVPQVAGSSILSDGADVNYTNMGLDLRIQGQYSSTVPMHLEPLMSIVPGMALDGTFLPEAPPAQQQGIQQVEVPKLIPELVQYTEGLQAQTRHLQQLTCLPPPPPLLLQVPVVSAGQQTGAPSAMSQFPVSTLPSDNQIRISSMASPKEMPPKLNAVKKYRSIPPKHTAQDD